INMLIGGGNHPGKTCVEVLVDDRVVRSVTGHNDNRLRPESIDVGDLQGKTAQVRIADRESGPWGNIGVDDIVFSDRPSRGGPLEEQPDFGSMCLGLLDPEVNDVTTRAALAEGNYPPGVFSQPEERKGLATALFNSKLVGSLARRAVLDPRQKVTVTF